MMSEMVSRKMRGAQGEGRVANYLQERGYHVLARNVFWRGGEIDLVVERGEVMAFVEVKLRANRYLSAAELVPPAKQHKIIKTARYFIAQNHISERVFRYDVALVDVGEGHEEITYFESAFAGEGEYVWDAL